jgi:hypothetical protein
LRDKSALEFRAQIGLATSRINVGSNLIGPFLRCRESFSIDCRGGTFMQDNSASRKSKRLGNRSTAEAWKIVSGGEKRRRKVSSWIRLSRTGAQ